MGQYGRPSQQQLGFLFVLEVGRGRDVLERSLEITEVLRGVEGGDGDRKPACTFFWKKDRESVSRLSQAVKEFKLATNNMLGYDMSRVKLKITCTARFCVDSRW